MLFAFIDCKVNTVGLKVKLEKSRPEHVLRNSDLKVTRCVVTNLIILMTVIFLIVAKQRYSLLIYVFIYFTTELHFVTSRGNIKFLGNENNREAKDT